LAQLPSAKIAKNKASDTKPARGITSSDRSAARVFGQEQNRALLDVFAPEQFVGEMVLGSRVGPQLPSRPSRCAFFS